MLGNYTAPQIYINQFPVKIKVVLGSHLNNESMGLFSGINDFL
jgi:hypothetical protein